MCLIGFCDASSEAYAALVYLAMRTSIDTVKRYVAARTRVVPIQLQTILSLGLELFSALLPSRLITIVCIAENLKWMLPMTLLKWFTDSKVVLF